MLTKRSILHWCFDQIDYIRKFILLLYATW